MKQGWPSLVLLEVFLTDFRKNGQSVFFFEHEWIDWFCAVQVCLSMTGTGEGMVKPGLSL